MSTPNTTVIFYDVYDLTPDYINTRWFNDVQAREDYFTSHIGEIVTPTQHIRIDGNQCKIPLPLEDIHTYNYMSIQNSKVMASGSDHKYYCFVTDMEYVSDMCTLVTFEVDVMQTFMHDITVWSALVERCHNDTDDFGDNIIAEPFKPSDYIVNDEAFDGTLEQMMLVVGVSTKDKTITLNVSGTPWVLQSSPITYYKDAYTCVRYYKFNLSGINTDPIFQAFLDYFDSTKISEIADMYICPKIAIPDYNDNVTEIANTESTKVDITPLFNYKGKNGTSNYEKLSGYSPKNKKMYCYPFNMLRVNNGEGVTKDYSFELFDDPLGFQEFTVEGSFMGEPSLTLYPKEYKRKTTTVDDVSSSTDVTRYYNYDESITLNDYPKCAYNADSYAMYQSNHRVSNAIKVVSSTVAGAIAGALIGGPVMGLDFATIFGGASFAKARMGVAQDNIKAYQSGDTTLGNQTGTNVAVQHGHKNFTFSRICVNAQYAEEVDNFFTMFGYAQNKIIDIESYLSNGKRPYYKYIKCSNFTVQGGFETKYKLKIADILNTGITFWFRTSTPIGDYSVDNKPVTPT